MKKLFSLLITVAFLSGCTTLTYSEKNTIRSLKAQGISVDRPVGPWDAPNNMGAAGGLNLLPGVGNFYLATGNGSDKSHYLYGFLNLLTWPLSILWGVPEAAIDANTINERKLVYFYTYDESGKEALKDLGFEVSASGKLERVH